MDWNCWACAMELAAGMSGDWMATAAGCGVDCAMAPPGRPSSAANKPMPSAVELRRLLRFIMVERPDQSDLRTGARAGALLGELAEGHGGLLPRTPESNAGMRTSGPCCEHQARVVTHARKAGTGEASH